MSVGWTVAEWADRKAVCLVAPKADSKADQWVDWWVVYLVVYLAEMRADQLVGHWAV